MKLIKKGCYQVFFNWKLKSRTYVVLRKYFFCSLSVAKAQTCNEVFINKGGKTCVNYLSQSDFARTYLRKKYIYQQICLHEIFNQPCRYFILKSYIKWIIFFSRLMFVIDKAHNVKPTILGKDSFQSSFTFRLSNMGELQFSQSWSDGSTNIQIWLTAIFEIDSCEHGVNNIYFIGWSSKWIRTKKVSEIPPFYRLVRPWNESLFERYPITVVALQLSPNDILFWSLSLLKTLFKEVFLIH